MSSPLRRVLVCTPQAAGWRDDSQTARWRDLGYRRAPDVATAEAQHSELRRALEDAGAEVISPAPADGTSLDAIYIHDSSLVTDHGAILMHMGKPPRRGESTVVARFYESDGIPILGRIQPPGTAEAGDIVWLDANTLLVGHGYRTNAQGIEQLRELLEPVDVDVVGAPLPHGPGPSACLHLMSLMSILEDRVALVDLPWLSVQTVELLQSRRFELIEIDPAERDTMACNVLALGDHRLLALAENPVTNARLRERGFDVAGFSGTEVSQNGGGGPTCLTRPLLRG